MSCCAPCSAGAIKQLADDGADFIVLFYNPNISPESEYQKRLIEQIKLCESLDVKYVIGEYDHDKWLSCVCGLEDEPERGRRCAECFKMRIAWGVDRAREHGYNTLATVFGISKWKDQKQIDEAGAQICANAIQYIPVNWDESMRIDENKKYDFYRQKYCGCEFSMPKK